MSPIALAGKCVIGLLFLLLAACASQDPYHQLAGAAGNCATQSEKTEPTAQCQQSYYQEYEYYDLAFAEYSERGNAFNDQWIDDILARIRERASDGVVVVVFVHGWRHNASEQDSNLINFRAALEKLATSHTNPVRDRRLVGLYVGWRGVSIDIPVLSLATFWDRKAVAETVGTGAITRLLLALEQIDSTAPDNVLVVIGHSFGGAIVVSALSEVLTGQIIRYNNHQTREAAPGAADAVFVLNPAIEANRMLNLVETARSHQYPPNQQPLFVSISSDADKATHYAFPLGQTVDLALTWNQSSLTRSYYRDRLTKEPLVLEERHLDATTIGNFAPYLTHRLTARETGSEVALELRECQEVPDECTPKGLTTLDGHPAFLPLPDNYPLYFIKTDKHVMTGHNDIFNDTIKAFMLALIDDTLVRSMYAAGSAPAAAPAPMVDGEPPVASQNRRMPPSSSILKNPAALKEKVDAYRQAQ